MNFEALLKNIRFYVLLFSLTLSGAIFLFVWQTSPPGNLQITQLVQLYALTAVTYLYLTLLIGPLVYQLRTLPYRSQIIRARRALGVSTFFFAHLHASLAFFGLLGGPAGLSFLTNQYLIAISLSFTALVILTLMAATSFDFMVAKLRSKWKLLHRFVYLAAFLILIHALMLGGHFTSLSEVIPQVFFFALAFLLLLEAPRVDKLISRFIPLPNFGVTALVMTTVLATIYFSFVNPIFNKNAGGSLSIHSAHVQLAQQAQTSTNQLPNIPGLQGDRTKRYTASFLHPENIKSSQDVTLRFQIFDASNGEKIQLFRPVYEKVVHMIVVGSSLEYFDHIHPTQNSDGFVISTNFPRDDVYHIYIDFQPWEGIEQQMAFTLNVGDMEKPVFSTAQAEKNPTKVFGDYQVSLTASDLEAEKMSLGQQRIKFSIKNASTKEPITTLKPYLAAFGHLVMINQKTFDYVHVHPANLTPPKANSNGGPDVEFLPIGIYGKFKPGIYRVFAQFNPNNELFTSDFTVEVR